MASTRPTRRSRRRVAAAALTALGGVTVLTATSAFADNPVGVPVTVATAAGTRQFDVQTVTGQPLTAVDLGTGGAAPFRVRVTDKAYDPGANKTFNVGAVVNNFYQVNPANSGYSYNKTIPATSASISFPTNPLAATGLSVPIDPTVVLSGSLPTCATLQTELGGVTAGTPLAGTVGTVVTGTLNTLDPICVALGSATTALPSTTSVTATLQKTLDTALGTLGLGDLPVNLATPTGGHFDAADYASGIGAGDLAGKVGKPLPTPITLLSGQENVTTALRNVINAAYTNVPLVGQTVGSGVTTVDAAVAALQKNVQTASMPIVSALATSSNTAAVADVLNSIATLQLPTVASILNLTGSYYSFPSINLTPPDGTEVGVYRGTMTVTYTQP